VALDKTTGYGPRRSDWMRGTNRIAGMDCGQARARGQSVNM
jgi:hypothetical protein